MGKALVAVAVNKQALGSEFGKTAACGCKRGLACYVGSCVEYMRMLKFVGAVGFGCEYARHA